MRLEPYLIGLFLLTPPLVGAGEIRPKSLYSAETLRKKLLDAQHRVKSLRVVYCTSSRDRERTQHGSYLYRVVAARAPCDYYLSSGHGDETLDWHDDPHYQRATVIKGRLYNEYSVNRLYNETEFRPEDGLPGSLPLEFFYLAIGLWPLDGCRPPRPDGRPYMLCEIALSGDYSRVRPEQEKVDGRWCHVLEFPGCDRLWIDVQHGCVLMARETYSQLSSALVQRIECGGYREVSPGAWMPNWVRNIQYDHTAPTEEGRRRIYIDATFDILESEVNHVDDNLFVFKPRPGSIRLESGVMTQVVPGGLDHLDGLARWIGKYYPPKQGSEPIPIASIASSVTILLILAVEATRRWGRMVMRLGCHR